MKGTSLYLEVNDSGRRRETLSPSFFSGELNDGLWYIFLSVYFLFLVDALFFFLALIIPSQTLFKSLSSRKSCSEK